MRFMVYSELEKSALGVLFYSNYGSLKDLVSKLQARGYLASSQHEVEVRGRDGSLVINSSTGKELIRLIPIED